MSRPIYEPSLTKTDAALGYGSRQLFRRPPPVHEVATLHIKVFPDEFFDVSFPVTIGDEKFIFAVAEDMDQMALSRVEAFVTTVSAGADIEVGIRNKTQAVLMINPLLTIDAGEKNSGTSASPPVITPGQPVDWMDEIEIYVEDPGDGEAFGLGVILEFV